MLKLAIIFGSSIAGAGLVTAILLHFQPTRWLLRLLQLGSIGAVVAYAAAFLVFYRPEVWPQVALEIAGDLARIDLEVLSGLGGSFFGTLLTQFLIGRIGK